MKNNAKCVHCGKDPENKFTEEQGRKARVLIAQQIRRWGKTAKRDEPNLYAVLEQLIFTNPEALAALVSDEEACEAVVKAQLGGLLG